MDTQIFFWIKLKREREREKKRVRKLQDLASKEEEKKSEKMQKENDRRVRKKGNFKKWVMEGRWIQHFFFFLPYF